MKKTSNAKKNRTKGTNSTKGTNIKNITIKPSPPKEVLVKFGGTIKIEDYRKNLYTNKKHYKITEPPVISIIPTITEEDSFNLEDLTLDIVNSDTFTYVDMDNSQMLNDNRKTTKSTNTIRSIEEYYNNL